MIDEYKSDEMTQDRILKFLCSLSNDRKFENALSFAIDVNMICKKIIDVNMKAPVIDEKEFTKIVRMFAIENDVDDVDMEENTKEMMKMKRYYEVKFKQHGIETHEHRMSYMLDPSFRTPHPPPPSPPSPYKYCGCGSRLAASGNSDWSHKTTKFHLAWIVAGSPARSPRV